MRLLAVPNWSFGRNRALMLRFRETLDHAFVTTHYCKADVDHNRTVTAFSGDAEEVQEVLLRLCDIAFGSIDLNRHTGVHPRVGALDVCPFVLLEGQLLDALAAAEQAAAKIASTYDLPVFLYEKSERGRHEADLPSLRRGGFGTLLEKQLKPDFGPITAHPRLGVAIMGVRGFLIAFNVNFNNPDPGFVKELAGRARELRSDGDTRFLGVRTLGFPIASKNASQLSFNLTLPDVAKVDPLVEWAIEEGIRASVPFKNTELIGVIREKDLPDATRLKIAPQQVVKVC